MIKKAALREHWKEYILVLIVLTEIAILTFIAYRFGICHVDSDDATEMALAEQLSRESGFLSPNWYYSTDLRVVHTQIILAPLFRLFSSWKLVRTFGTVILLCILSGSWIFMCGKISMGRSALWLLPVLLWPFSDIYYDFVLFGLQYIPHLAMMFIGAGVYFAIIHSKKYSWNHIVVWLVLAVLNGMGGLRLIVVFYAPLWMAAVWSYIIKEDSTIGKAVKAPQIVFSSLGMIGVAVGYIINTKILSQMYTFVNWESTEFIKPDFTKINGVLNDLLMVMGYRTDRKIFSISGGVNLLMLVSCCFLVYIMIELLKNLIHLKEDERIITIFAGLSLCVTIFVNLFTNQNWAARYLILPMIWLIVLVAIYIRLKGIMRPVNQLICICLLTTVFCGGLVEYRAWISYNKNSARESVLRFLEDEGYRFGYASWDNADVLTEMTDGQIRTCKVTNWKDFSIWYWLMDKDYRKYAEGQKVFVLLNNNEFNYDGGIGYLNGSWKAEDLGYLDSGHQVYRDECYTVYSFDDYRRLEQRKW